MSKRPASDNSASANDGHAVRWVTRLVRVAPQWTRWHWVDQAGSTVCGRWVPVPFVVLLVSEDPAAVDCKRCRRWLRGRNGPD